MGSRPRFIDDLSRGAPDAAASACRSTTTPCSTLTPARSSARSSACGRPSPSSPSNDACPATKAGRGARGGTGSGFHLHARWLSADQQPRRAWRDAYPRDAGRRREVRCRSRRRRPRQRPRRAAHRLAGAAAACRARRLLAAFGRTDRDRRRQSARPRADGHDRRRLRARAVAAFELRPHDPRCDPDRRRAQSRQLGRSAHQLGGPGDRREHCRSSRARRRSVSRSRSTRPSGSSCRSSRTDGCGARTSAWRAPRCRSRGACSGISAWIWRAACM